jgi:hypothetical protein
MASLTGETKERDDVKNFLRDHNLENYYQNIVDEGYDTLDDLRNIDLLNLMDIGLEKGHAKRLLRIINEQGTNENTLPEGTLRVQPGLNSLSKAVTAAKEQGIDCLLLECGVHDEKGENVEIDFALKVVGQNKDDVKIKAGLWIKGKEKEDVFFTDCTVTGANEIGVYGDHGAALHLKNVCVEKCGIYGVSVYSTKRNTMTDCNVNNNEWSGVRVQGGGCMTIDGRETTIHHNVTGGKSDRYGLDAYGSSSFIHLKSLTKESISTNNGGGGNYGGKGTIKTIETAKEDTGTTTKERTEKVTSSGETKTSVTTVCNKVSL